MDMLFKCLPFELKAASQDGSFEGLCAAFCNIDSSGEIIDPAAFDGDIPAFLADGFIGGLNHNWDSPIGKPMAAVAQKAGLYVKGQISNTPHGQECRTLMQDGVVKKLSIGYRVMGDMMLEDADQVAAYWQSKAYTPNAQDMARCMMGARVLTAVKLYEFSPVTVPANDLATITAVKRIAYEAAEKAVSGSTTLPLGSRDAAWDQSAADKRVRGWADANDAPNAKYRSAFFWYDAQNADNFTAYKLQFADVVNGELRAMPRGIFACAGAHGVNAADIPENDKAGIRRKISRYYARMREEFNDPSLRAPWDSGKALESVQTLREAEEWLRETGSLSREEAKTFIAVVKPLLRDAASDAPEPESIEPEVKASETPAEEPAPEPEPVTPEPPVISPAILRKRQDAAALAYQRFLAIQAGLPARRS